MREGWRRIALGDIATQYVEPLHLLPDEEYQNLGVKWYAEGTFLREPKLGSEIKTTRLFRVRPGQFVYNRMFVTEGSFGIVQPEDKEALASNEFPVFDIAEDRALTDFIVLHFQQPDVWEQIASEATGTTKSRRRWKEDQFLRYTIALPPLDEQRRIVDLIGSVDDAIEAAEQALESLHSANEAMRDFELWSTDERVPLSELCEVDGSLVSPTGDLASLPHVGAERIEGGNGDLVGVVSAAEDGVTSGKYLFDDRHVIYSKIRPNLRKVALPTDRGLCSADAYALLPADSVPRDYLQQLLLSAPFTDVAVSRSGRTKMPKINRTELMSILVPVHPPAEKRRLAARFAEISRTRKALRRNREGLRTLRSNLLTALLSGDHEIPKSYDELLEVAPA